MAIFVLHNLHKNMKNVHAGYRVDLSLLNVFILAI